MTYLLAGYLLALLVSLFVASWRMAVWAFAAESLAAGLILIRSGGAEAGSGRIQAVDLILVRAVIVPLILIGVLKKLKTPKEFDIVPANLVVWTFAVVLLISSYWFGHWVFPSESQSAFHLGTAVAGVLTGIFVLANQSWLLGQMIGLLTLEAGISLTESLGHHQLEWEIQLGLAVVFFWMFALFVNFLKRLSAMESEVPTVGTATLGEKDVL